MHVIADNACMLSLVMLLASYLPSTGVYFIGVASVTLLPPRTPLGPAATSIFRTPNSGADMFAADSDVEATPKVHGEKNFFQTPSME